MSWNCTSDKADKEWSAFGETALTAPPFQAKNGDDHYDGQKCNKYVAALNRNLSTIMKIQTNCVVTSDRNIR